MSNHFIGVGSYIPTETIPNAFFTGHTFFNEEGDILAQDHQKIISDLEQITGIKERKYARKELVTSDLGYRAAVEAILEANIDPETLDYIIFAHNFGDISYANSQPEMVPNLASRVKNLLHIKNIHCVTYDLLFGCTGWIEGVILANTYIKAGLARRCLVIGAETLSRTIDKYDRDSMVYADGAGAVILEQSESTKGIKSHLSVSYTGIEHDYLFLGKSNHLEKDEKKYIKMYGYKLYEFALHQVPSIMKKCVDDSVYQLGDIKKILIHQSNEKINRTIVKHFFRLYQKHVPENIMPTVIEKLGNSGVATVPILLKSLLNPELNQHKINEGDVILFVSIGAGMHINAFIYQY